MDSIIKKMRADWVVVAEERRACGEWSAEDEAQIGEAVKAAIAAGKPDLIACWSRWLADLAASTVALKAIALNIDARMRKQAQKQRDSDAKKAA